MNFESFYQNSVMIWSDQLINEVLEWNVFGIIHFSVKI